MTPLSSPDLEEDWHTPMGTHIVQLSGGVGSWATAKRVAEKHGTENLVCLFADVRAEDEDTYRFLLESAANVGTPRLEVACDGRTPWELFHQQGMIGNTRADLCSRILKRELLRKWLEDHYAPNEAIIYVGFDWTEQERIERSRRFWLPYTVKFPLADKPYLWKTECIDWCRAEGMEPPALTREGFSHANCGGACVKAGQAQWKHLYLTRPKTYAEWEANEERFRTERGKDVAILRDRRGGETKPLSLRVFRERLEADPNCSLFDEGGGCGCI